jgi:ABC-type phosphate transport system substrate-binding protein
MRARAMWPLLLALCVPWYSLPAQGEAFSGFEVVANDIGVSELTAAQVRAIFRGDRSLWSTGQAVTVVLPSGRVPYADEFARSVLGMSRDAMQRYWLGLVFQGRAAPPVHLASAAEIIAYVERTPGAIAVVPLGLARRALVIPVR